MTGQTRVEIERVVLRVTWQLEVEGAVAEDACNAIVGEAVDAAIALGADRYGVPPTAMGACTTAARDQASPWIQARIAALGGRVTAWTVLAIDL